MTLKGQPGRTGPHGKHGFNSADGRTPEQEKALIAALREKEKARRAATLKESRNRGPRATERLKAMWAKRDAALRANKLNTLTCAQCNRIFTQLRRPYAVGRSVIYCPACRREKQLLAKRLNWQRHKDEYNAQRKAAGTFNKVYKPHGPLVRDPVTKRFVSPAVSPPTVPSVAIPLPPRSDIGPAVVWTPSE